MWKELLGMGAIELPVWGLYYGLVAETEVPPLSSSPTFRYGFQASVRGDKKLETRTFFCHSRKDILVICCFGVPDLLEQFLFPVLRTYDKSYYLLCMNLQINLHTFA